MIGILLTAVGLLLIKIVSSITAILDEAFDGEWLKMEDSVEEVYVDDSEYDWGHNVKGYKSEEE